MSGFLFQQFVFGPISSRRLGRSLGINLLPVNQKYCSFNCVYCECGWTPDKPTKLVLPSRAEVKNKLENRLCDLVKNQKEFDAITFAGNGEPTLHPDFPEIINDTIALRNIYFPEVKVAVLSNATTCHNPQIASALEKVDLNILKLDAGTEGTFALINKPKGNLSLKHTMDNLMLFKGKMILQTLFIKGSYNNQDFDNTTNHEIEAWLELVKKLQPVNVMIYSIARGTPVENLEKIPKDKLLSISQKVQDIGISTTVY